MILTVDELREHVTSGLEDDALQRLLDAAEAAIVGRAGEPGVRTETFDGGYRFLTTANLVDSVSSITEAFGSTSTILAADDYHADGYVIERLNTGTNPRHTWQRRVTVVYTPQGDDALRELVQIELVQSDLNYNPGLTSQTIGTWTEQYSNSQAWHNAAEWESILQKLDTGVGMLVVGSRR